MTSGIFWNLEIGNREIWKIPEIGWFGPILIFWVYFPLSLGHWAWLWSQNCKIPIFLEFCQKFSGNLEIPRCWLIWTNLDVLGIISTQFLSLTSIFNSELPDSNYFAISPPEIFRKSRNSLFLCNFNVLGIIYNWFLLLKLILNCTQNLEFPIFMEFLQKFWKSVGIVLDF